MIWIHLLVWFFLLTRSVRGELEELRVKPIHGILDVTGTLEAFLKELKHIERYASELRDGIPCEIEAPKPPFIQGWCGIVVKLVFADGVKWAAKVIPPRIEPQAFIGFNALWTLQRYCPHIPAPKVYGKVGEICDGDLTFYLMDWIDGIPLSKSPNFRTTPYRENPELYILNVTLPEHFIQQFAQFIFNLTTCQIPHHTLKCINRFEDDHIPDSQVWARQTVISDLSLLNAHINDGFDGIKAFLYLSWVTATIVPGMPWVLSHWDNKPHNIMVDEKDNFLAMVDWDDAKVVPLRLTEVTFGQRIRDRSGPKRIRTNISQESIYEEAMTRLSAAHPDAKPRMGPRLDENAYFECALLESEALKLCFEDTHPLFSRTPENMFRARVEWEKFAATYFYRRNRPVPYWQWCEDVQEGLGIVGNSTLERAGRWLKRETDRQLETVLGVLAPGFPEWEWIQKKYCYMQAAFSEEYVLPGRRVSC